MSKKVSTRMASAYSALKSTMAAQMDGTSLEGMITNGARQVMSMKEHRGDFGEDSRRASANYAEHMAVELHRKILGDPNLHNLNGYSHQARLWLALAWAASHPVEEDQPVEEASE